MFMMGQEGGAAGWSSHSLDSDFTVSPLAAPAPRTETLNTSPFLPRPTPPCSASAPPLLPTSIWSAPQPPWTPVSSRLVAREQARGTTRQKGSHSCWPPPLSDCCPSSSSSLPRVSMLMVSPRSPCPEPPLHPTGLHSPPLHNHSCW